MHKGKSVKRIGVEAQDTNNIQPLRRVCAHPTPSKRATRSTHKPHNPNSSCARVQSGVGSLPTSRDHTLGGVQCESHRAQTHPGNPRYLAQLSADLAAQRREVVRESARARCGEQEVQSNRAPSSKRPCGAPATAPAAETLSRRLLVVLLCPRSRSFTANLRHARLCDNATQSRARDNKYGER